MYISDFVLAELNEGNFPQQIEALGLTRNINIPEHVSKIDQIVDFYIKSTLMPSKDIRDALHLAYTSLYKIDVLLTWNCTHLANINKREHIKNINLRLGLFVPEIITPLELRV